MDIRQTIAKDFAAQKKRQRTNEKRIAMTLADPRTKAALAALVGIGVEPSVALQTPSIDVSVTGGADRLAAVWAILRHAELIPDEHVGKEPKSYFATFFRERTPAEPTWQAGDDRRVPFWLSFSSTVCERVQVGEEVVRRPIYAVRCKDAEAA